MARKDRPHSAFLCSQGKLAAKLGAFEKISTRCEVCIRVRSRLKRLGLILFLFLSGPLAPERTEARCPLIVRRALHWTFSTEGLRSVAFPYRKMLGAQNFHSSAFQDKDQGPFDLAYRVDRAIRAATAPTGFRGVRPIETDPARRSLILAHIWQLAEMQSLGIPLEIQGKSLWIFDPQIMRTWIDKPTITYADYLQLLSTQAREIEIALTPYRGRAWSAPWHFLYRNSGRVAWVMGTGTTMAVVFWFINSFLQPVELKAARAERHAYEALGSSVLSFDPKQNAAEDLSKIETDFEEAFIAMKGHLPRPSREMLDNIFYYHGVVSMHAENLRILKERNEQKEIDRIVDILRIWRSARTEVLNSPAGQSLRERLDQIISDYAPGTR